jgi:hypothetical protein
MNKIINILFTITTTISIGYVSYRLFKLSNNEERDIELVQKEIRNQLDCHDVSIIDSKINKTWKIYCPSPEGVSNFKCFTKEKVIYGTHCSYLIQKNIIKIKP